MITIGVAIWAFATGHYIVGSLLVLALVLRNT